MANIAHVELSDTFNRQRETINQLIDLMNTGGGFVPGEGIERDPSGSISIKISGDGLSFDGNGSLVGNDAFPNLMTQVVFDPDVAVPVPTVTSDTTISFPAFKVIFDNKVYYGKKISDFDALEIPPTIMTVDTGEDGAVFVYVDNAGEIHQSLNSVSPANSSTQCLLGSYFRLGNRIQENSWAYTPWNGSTDKERRFTTGGSLNGGILEVLTGTTLSRSAISVILEGINAKNSLYTPNSMSFEADIPYSTKKIWPGYDASVADSTTLDTTHIYNMTTHQVDDISNVDGYVALIPGIVGPTGQDVYLMAMSEIRDNYRAREFKSIYSGYVPGQFLQEFVYVNGKYIGVTGVGGITTSSDGFSWSTPVQKLTHPGFIGEYWIGLIYDGQNLIAVSDDGDIAYCPMTSNWSPQSDWTITRYADDFTFWYNLTYLNDNIIVGGRGRDNSHQYLIISDRGGATYNWRQVEVPALVASGMLLYDGSKYISITINGVIYTSTDLETWTKEADDPNIGPFVSDKPAWVSFIHDGTQYIILGSKGTNPNFQGYYSTSTDGITWDEVKRIDNCGRLLNRGTTYLNGKVWLLSSNNMANLVFEPYTQVFDSMEEAKASIYNLKVDLGNVASRVIWMGQTIIAKIGTTNFLVSDNLQIVPEIPYSLGVYGSESSGGSGSRVSGITVKANGVVIGEELKKTSVNFASGFTVTNDSENDVSVIANASAATQEQVNTGTENLKYVTPATLKGQTYLATIEFVGNVSQSTTGTDWPTVTSVESWPHTIIITVNDNYSIPNVQPLYTDKVLTWEVVIRNVNSSSISLTWPSAYQAFNNENLPSSVAPNTSVFMMMRKYSNNYTLVSTQGVQSNTIF